MSKRRAMNLGAGVLGALGLLSLSYLWYVLGQRGLEADANGTSGYTTNTEIALLFFGVTSVILAITILVVGVAKRDA